MEAIPDADAMAAPVVNPVHRLDVQAALGHLRPAERVCVLLAYSEGMSHPEIAGATGLPLGTVKSHVSRGAARLRRWLTDGVDSTR